MCLACLLRPQCSGEELVNLGRVSGFRFECSGEGLVNLVGGFG